MKETQCPKCNARLPKRGRFCLDCGLDLYGEGLRRPPIPWFRIIAVPAVAAGVLAVLIIGPCQREKAPEVEAVVASTRELLRLLGEKDYRGVVARFSKGNRAHFADAEATLHAIARGEGAPGLNIARSHGFRSIEEVLAYVQKHGASHPEYVAALLYTILSHPDPNPWLGPGRTETFFAWYLEQTFGEADAGHAEPAPGDPLRDGRRFTVEVVYPEPFGVLKGVADPTKIPWRLEGGWGGCRRPSAVLEFGTDDHLDTLLELLKRLPAE